jgi:ferric-dicitrate binding protein FerR (iron transport regulator)
MGVLLLAVGLLWPRGAEPVTLAAAPGTTETARLPDGSTVTLAPGSALRYAPDAFAHGDALGDADEARRVALTGEAYFDVARGQAPFVVETRGGNVTVLGTAFNVRAVDATTEVALEEGRVRLSAARGATARASVTMSPGDVAVATEDTVAVVRARLEDALAWRRGGFAFVDQPLGRIAEDVARRYGVDVRLEPASLRERAFTLILERPDGPEAVLADLSEYAGLTLRATESGFVLSDAPAQ